MKEQLFWMIAGMTLVTYIPRMLPLVFFDANKIPAKLQAILRNVPYAALGALIFPGIFTINENIWFGIIGGITAIFFSYIGANLIIVVLSSIFVLSIVSLLL